MSTSKTTSESFFMRQTALRVSSIYLVFGIVYIYLSGWLVLQIFDDPTKIARAEMYKGWGFIFSSSVLLFLLVHAATNALRRSTRRQIEAESQYRSMIETTNEGVWQLDENAHTVFVNQTMVDILGVCKDDMIGKPEAMFLDDKWSSMALDRLERHRAGSRDVYECYFRRPDGKSIWAVVSATPMHDARGNFTGVLRMVTDITKRKTMELELKDSLLSQRQLLNELDHRVRNNLSSLISLVDISRGISDDSDTFAASIRGRIDAMNRAHNLLSATGWKPQNLRELLSVLIQSEHRKRVILDGPDVPCPADVSGALAIIFHELLANATRFGALSGPDGHVNVSWTTSRPVENGSVDVTVIWRETGGRSPAEHITYGAGLRLVSGLVRSDLRGSANFSFSSEGAFHELNLSFVSGELPTQPASEVTVAAVGNNDR